MNQIKKKSTNKDNKTNVRSCLSIHQQIEIQEKTKQDNSFTQSDLAKWTNERFNSSIDRSTVSKILAKKLDKNSFTSNRKKIYPPKFPKLEKILFNWFLWYENINECSDGILLARAEEIAREELKITPEELKLSNGWLDGFKKRHNIKNYNLHGEASSIIDCSAEIKIIQEEIKKYNLNDVYNYDETGLFYRMTPNQTLATKSRPGKKKDKSRVTFGFCTNASGNHKLKPFVVGSAIKPRCFKSIKNIKNLNIIYRSNKKAWMTGSLFKEWIERFDKNVIKIDKKRKVLLIIDGCSSHNIVNHMSLENTKIIFLPPNCPAKYQPLNAGIIFSFKKRYRRRFCKHFLDLSKKNQVSRKLNLLEAINFAVDSWFEISPAIILNCWHRSELIKDEFQIDDSEENILTQELINQIEELENEQVIDINEFIEPEEERIIELPPIEPVNQVNDCETDEDEDEIEVEPISHLEATNSCDKLLLYLMQQSCDTRSYIEKIKNIMKEIERNRVSSLKQTSIDGYFKRNNT